MPLINPNINADGPINRLKNETNPRYRRMLEEVRYHNQIEASGLIDPVMDRLAPNPIYWMYEHGKDPVSIQGRDDIKAHFYDELMRVINPLLEWNTFRCLVDDDGVITEGTLKAAVRGTWLIEQGYDVDPEGFYLRHSQHLVVWPFDDQVRSLGETIYYGYSDPLDMVVQHKLKPEDIGPYEGPFELPTTEVFERA